MKHRFKHGRKIIHHWWLGAAWHCVQLWIFGGEKHLGWNTVYVCTLGAKWYEEAERHYHVGRKGRLRRERKIASGVRGAELR